MASSGTQTFTQTRDELILDAFQLLGVYGIGRTISSEDNELASRLLNKMIKAWSTKGLHLWEKNEGVMFLQPSVSSFTLGSTGRVTSVNDLRMPTLETAAASSSSTIMVDDASQVLAADNIGIVLTDLSIHWTTVVSVIGDVITLTDSLVSGASANAVVFVYTDAIYKPLRILDARYIIRYGNADSYEQPLNITAYQDYMQIPVKAVASRPNQLMYKPEKTSGTAYIWPQTSDASGRIQFTYERMIEDMAHASDNFDFPSEWLEALTYQLAMRLGFAFGKLQKASSLQGLASQMLQDLLSWDREVTEVQYTFNDWVD